MASTNLLDVPGVLRGAPWAGTDDVPYPRADPADFDRLPIDTWAMAAVPAAVRLELEVDGVESLEIDYVTTTADLGYRGDGAGTTFALWADGAPVTVVAAALGTHTAQLALPAGARHLIVYLPEGMRPRLLAVRARGGTATSPPAGPRWVCYGDSIAEGWAASEPARSWPVVASRWLGLDVVNLGYAGAARGEIVSAGHVASLRADVISLSHGTNCWSRTPHSTDQIVAGYHAFLDVVRTAHPATPIVAVSPVIRPDAETTPNVLGATLDAIRAAIEETVAGRQKADPALTLVEGAPILEAGDLTDGVHPGDRGHEKMADVIGPVVAGVAGIIEGIVP